MFPLNKLKIYKRQNKLDLVLGLGTLRLGLEILGWVGVRGIRVGGRWVMERVSRMQNEVS